MRICKLVFLVAVFCVTERLGAAELPKPFVVVEAWHSRANCSDLYAYSFEGKLLRRLTDKPLPSCSLQAVSRDGGQVTFVANASALYSLSTRWESLSALHAGDAQAVAMPWRGTAVAYAARGFERKAGWFLYLQPIVAGAFVERTEIPLKEVPQEMSFASDGHRLLLTIWEGDRARIDWCDLETRKFDLWMSDPGFSYYDSDFGPEGKVIALIAENLGTGEWSIVSRVWPNGELKTLYTGPRGVPVAMPTFTEDGKYLLFKQNGVLARMAPDGGTVEGVSGMLDQTPRPEFIRGGEKRMRPERLASIPLRVKRFFAMIEAEQPDGAVSIVDVYAKERKRLPLPPGKVLRAVVVE